MAASNKNGRAWTPQDVKALECAMISKLGTDINSIDQADIRNPNKLPLKAKPTNFWCRRLKLEKSNFKNSSILAKDIVNKIENTPTGASTNPKNLDLSKNLNLIKIKY